MAESNIITGQYVRISQVQANVGERILARLIDYAILFVYLMCSFYVVDHFYLARLSGLSVILFFAVVYIPLLFYSLLCEVFNNGQSIGKKIMKIRVVKLDGSVPTLGSYLLRWLLYLVDVPLTSGLGIIVVLVTKNGQRLGDLAAGTMVVKEKNYRKIHISLDEFYYLSDDYRPVFPQAADLSLEQVNVITKTLYSRNKGREAHVSQLSQKIRKVLSIPAAANDNEQFLQVLLRDYQYFSMQIV